MYRYHVHRRLLVFIGESPDLFNQQVEIERKITMDGYVLIYSVVQNMGYDVFVDLESEDDVVFFKLKYSS